MSYTREKVNFFCAEVIFLSYTRKKFYNFCETVGHFFRKNFLKIFQKIEKTVVKFFQTCTKKLTFVQTKNRRSIFAKITSRCFKNVFFLRLKNIFHFGLFSRVEAHFWGVFFLFFIPSGMQKKSFLPLLWPFKPILKPTFF